MAQPRVFKPVGVDQDSLFPPRVETRLNNAFAALPSAKKNALTGWWHVDGFGADTTGAVDSTTAVQTAVNAIVSAGGSGKLYYPAGTYRHDFIDFKGCQGLQVEGAGKGATIIRTTSNRTTTLSRIFGSTGACSNLLFTGITFQGTAVDDLASNAQPRRARTYSSFGFNSAILFVGDLVPATGGGTDPDPAKFVISNITIRDVEVIGSGGTDAGGTPTYSGLPIFLQGIRGEARIEQCRFVNTLDVGWTFCDQAIGIGNRSIRSADNGFSFSRGNKSVTAIGNRAHQAAYWAVWIAGFSSDLGPTDIVCADNSGSILGYGGVCADVAPQHFSITGGVFRQIYRGPSDGATDNYGVGILISGYPSGSTTPSAYAQNFTISGVTIIDAARGGILVRGAKNGGIYANTIIRPGSTYLADGTTVVTTSMAPQNFGIAADQSSSSTVSNIDVQSNVIIDDRGTPVLNNAVYSGSAVNWTQNGNRTVGNRLQLSESARTWSSGAQTFAALLTATAGIKVGSVGAASTVSHRLSAPAGITREVRFETSDITRWSFRANSAPETGSNSGSDFQLLAYADDGTTVLSTPIQILRSTGAALFAGAISASNLSGTNTGDQGFGYPFTIDPASIRGTDALGVGTANQAIYTRVAFGGTITKIGLQVIVSSGNISVAVYRNSGSGRLGVPSVQLATSGSIACPAVGYTEISLGTAATLLPGDWIAITADNTTATFRTAIATGADSGLGNGRQYRQITAHPAPTTPASLIPVVGYAHVIVGV